MVEKDFIEKTLDFSKKLDVSLVKDIIIFESINSTNSKAKDLAKKGAEEGTVVISEIQKKGRGRFERVWESPEGGLYFSIILKPKCEPEKSTLLPLIGALSVCKTITSISDLNVIIKWPNDVLIKGKKVSGILLESESDKNNLKYVVLGIGINLNIELSALSEELHSNSTSIAHEIGIKLNYYDFLKKLLLNLDNYYMLFDENKFDFLIKEWKENTDTLGKKVIIDTSTEKISGRAVDIDDCGFLIVVTETGQTKKITSGDCIYLE
jgi:BirA family biotin operon repressor/biotin-[acetyl-CoA-carboxylase] ligase